MHSYSYLSSLIYFLYKVCFYNLLTLDSIRFGVNAAVVKCCGVFWDLNFSLLVVLALINPGLFGVPTNLVLQADKTDLLV